MSKPIAANRFTDLGMERDDLESFLAESGYWGSAQAKERYRYVLSPSAYVLTTSQKHDLERLAVSTHNAVQTLNARLCGIAARVSPDSHEDALLLRLGNVATRGLLKPSAGEYAIPPVIKVDLVQDPDGRFFIAEVDTYNPRGLGFVALLEESLSLGNGSSYGRFPGVRGVVELMQRDAVDSEWHLLVTEYERFYQTPFQIFANTLRKRFGITVHMLREEDVASGRAVIPEGARLIVIPDSLNQHPEVRDTLVERERRGELKTLFPPVAYLGSKAFLPFLRSCEGMEEFIPKSALVGKKCKAAESTIDLAKPSVLKATVSSGMKQVIFSDMDEGFELALAQARTLRNPSWILQEQVPQKSEPVVVFDEDGQRTLGHYYLRVTAYVAQDSIVDVEVTGRPDRKVHGAPDCIMVPVIF